MPRIFAPVLLMILTGCTAFPALDVAVGPDVFAMPYPPLLALDALLATGGTDATPDPTAALAKAAALQARADRLRALP